MGLFNWWKKKDVSKKDAFIRGARYEVVGGTITSPDDNKRSYITDGYNINDTIYSATNLIMDKIRIAPWGVYQVVDEGSLKLMRGLMSKKDLSGDDFKEIKRLRNKSLEPYENDDTLNRLLDYPNEYCTFSDFVAETSLFKMLTGGRMIWAELLDAGANAGKPYSLWSLPYQEVSIIAAKGWPVREVGYKLEAWNLADPVIPKEAVMHDKYFNPNFSVTGDHLYGFSPLKAALKLVTRSNSANKAATANFQNGGPKTVIFIDDERLAGSDVGGTEIQQIKKILQGKEYTGADNTNKLAGTSYRIGAVPLGLDNVDLAIIESEKWDLRRFCNVFSGIPSQLLNDPENKSYNNQKEGEKALTTRAALPQLNSFRDNFNRKLSDDWGYGGKNIIIDYDMSVYSELQDDNQAKWQWVRELPVPWGYKLDMMGLDYDDSPEMKEIMIPTGFQPIDGMNEVDEAINDE